MAEKLLLKQDQLEAIRWLQSEGYTFDDIIHGQDYKWSGENVACLNTLSVAQIAKILYTDEYEIEKHVLNNGDKVIYPKVNDIGVVIDNTVFWNDGSETDVDYTVTLMEADEMRLATEEEIYWLETLERDKLFGFKLGDAILDNGGNITRITTISQAKFALEHFTSKPDEFRGVYPSGSLKTLKKD